MNSCVKSIISGINKRGCFNLNYDNSKGYSDCQATVWNCLALRTALMAGSNVKGLKKCIKKSAEGLLSMQNKKTYLFVESIKGMAKVTKNGNPEMTWMALHALSAYALSNRQFVRNAYMTLIKKDDFFSINWNINNSNNNNLPINSTYHKTKVIFKFNSGTGPLWKKWCRTYTRYIIKYQNEDGSLMIPEINRNLNKNLKPFTSKMNIF